MAEYGVQLVNKYNLSISNAQDVNYTLRSSGVIRNSDFSVGSYTEPVSVCYMDLSSLHCPLVFFRPVNADSRICAFPSQMADFMPSVGERIDRTMMVLKWWNKTVSDIEYFIFDIWTPPERSPFGLQMFDGSGNIIFDSGWNFLMLSSVKWLDPGYPNHQNDTNGSNWTDVGHMGEGQLALALPNPRGWAEPGGMTVGWYLMECFHLQGNNARISLVPRGVYFWGSGSQRWTNNMRTQLMAADVSKMPRNYNPVRLL
ncbi:hypothetical protein [Klebsiella oxytoca]|uniref:hypothetical protein n=1 Tax=Klebsiella oxytoca TaxID=571 RepID=UPI001CCC045F|nr:hypothetical protein [Klebsiella oxytoca]MBZ7251338.1 hypothetical protein [Klebsiella oxytoca]HCQ7058019.1 hypothetical protein [Klebsiella oxytoca]HCQ7125111.1 hypothetical protein [Klebsiella oxytoca]HEC2083548.1 hypothetical protein [Klebsiella oxytoca]HEI8764384.1 hypothetical protein [Klebsiella oxytoca]